MCETLEEAIAGLQKQSSQNVVKGPSWSSEDFARLLSETKCAVPSQLEQTLSAHGRVDTSEFKYFLAQWSDGRVSKHEIQTLVKPSPDSMIDEFLSFRVNPDLNEDRFPYDMVFFGTADGGHSVLLANGTNPNDNTVYLWEKAGDPWGVGDNAVGIAKVADTFFGFLCGLIEEGDLYRDSG